MRISTALLLAMLLGGLLVHLDAYVGRGRVDRMTLHEFEQTAGVRIQGIAIGAGGGVLRIRYQVVDPGKVRQVFNHDVQLHVIDEVSGEELSRSWIEPPMSAEMHTGLIYGKLLSSTGRRIQPGSLVTLIIGDIRLEHILVIERRLSVFMA